MPRLFLLESGEPLGQISAAQLEALNEHLVAEDPGDRDYYLTKDTLDMLEESDFDPELLALLKKALGDREEIEIGWEG